MFAHLDDVVAAFEGDVAEPFRVDDVRAHAERIAPGLVAFEMDVVSLEGKLKLNQNRKVEDWAAVRERFGASGDAGEREMAVWMGRVGHPAGDEVDQPPRSS